MAFANGIRHWPWAFTKHHEALRQFCFLFGKPLFGIFVLGIDERH
jgi:hypothetical protein